MSDAHAQLLAGVRVSERMWCESDLYWRTNRWAEDGRSMDVSESFRWARLKDTVVSMKAGEFAVIAAAENVGRSTYQRTSR